MARSITEQPRDEVSEQVTPSSGQNTNGEDLQRAPEEPDSGQSTANNSDPRQDEKGQANRGGKRRRDLEHEVGQQRNEGADEIGRADGDTFRDSSCPRFGVQS